MGSDASKKTAQHNPPPMKKLCRPNGLKIFFRCTGSSMLSIMFAIKQHVMLNVICLAYGFSVGPLCTVCCAPGHLHVLSVVRASRTRNPLRAFNAVHLPVLLSHIACRARLYSHSDTPRGRLAQSIIKCGPPGGATFWTCFEKEAPVPTHA